MTQTDAQAGTHYAGLIAEQLQLQEATKESLEKRGTWVLASSGTFVTLLFGLVALSTGVEGFVPNSLTVDYLSVGLVLLVVAGIFSILTNWPLRYGVVSPATMGRLLPADRWSGPSDKGEREVAQARIELVGTAINKNFWKAVLLMSGMIAELLGVLFIALGLAVELGLEAPSLPFIS